MLDKPHTLACLTVYEAAREEEAVRQTESFAHSMMRMMKGQSYIVPSPEQLVKFTYSAHERHLMEGWRQKMIYGTG